MSPAIEIHPLKGDNTVLACTISHGGRIVAVVNSHYPEAEAHVRAHVVSGFDRVLICSPDCDSTQR